jgi:hypothetical protein
MKTWASATDMALMTRSRFVMSRLEEPPVIGSSRLSAMYRR